MYNGAEVGERVSLLEDYTVCVVFKHKHRNISWDVEKEIKNGNLIIVYPDGSMLKSEHIGLEYFRNNYVKVN
jgi:hypothetical protein